MSGESNIRSSSSKDFIWVRDIAIIATIARSMDLAFAKDDNMLRHKWQLLPFVVETIKVASVFSVWHFASALPQVAVSIVSFFHQLRASPLPHPYIHVRHIHALLKFGLIGRAEITIFSDVLSMEHLNEWIPSTYMD